MGMAEAGEWLLENRLEPAWEESTGQNYAELFDEGGIYQIWLEDAESAKLRMEVVRENGIAGVAAWCLGDELPEIWDVIEGGLK